MGVDLLTIAAALVVAAPAAAAVPADDGRILFTTGGHDLRTVAPGGGAWTPVPLPSNLRAGQAAWSPDGSRIAFRGGPDGDSEVWVVNADGSGLTKLTDTPNVSGDNRFSSQPGWSPDGTRIVFRSDREDGDADVWAMNADGGGVHRLVDAPGDQRYPALSPDGQRLVYRSDADGDADIWVAGADGSGAVPLTVNTTFDSAPAWSPDGSRIAFEAGPDATAAEGGAHYAEMELFSMAASGGDVRRLTSNGAHDEGPAWAPAGDGIVFTSERDGNSELYVMNVDGSGQRRLTDASTLEESPDWQAVPRAAPPGGGGSAGTPSPAPGGGAPAASGAASGAGSPAPAIVWPRFSIRSRTLRADRRGRIGVKVACPSRTP